MPRSGVLLALMIPVLAALSAACTVRGPGVGPASSGTVRVDDSHDGQKVDVPQGGSLVVSLESNPSTGYHWEVTDISDRQVLGEVGREFRPGKAPPDMVGVPGLDLWTFKALGRGTVRLLMSYIPPGRAPEGAAKTFDLQVIVN
jgi:inhibitor of cysteine peptidase